MYAFMPTLCTVRFACSALFLKDSLLVFVKDPLTVSILFSTCSLGVHFARQNLDFDSVVAPIHAGPSHH